MDSPVKADSLKLSPTYRRRYVSIRWKFSIALTVALLSLIHI